MPSTVSVKVQGYRSFNALKGETTGQPSVLEYSAKPYYQTYRPDAKESTRAAGSAWTLSMDYLFASPEKEVLTQMSFSAIAGGRKMERTFDNIPYRRNFRTNVYGSILTSGGSYKVLIAPEFNSPGYNL